MPQSLVLATVVFQFFRVRTIALSNLSCCMLPLQPVVPCLNELHRGPRSPSTNRSFAAAYRRTKMRSDASSVLEALLSFQDVLSLLCFSQQRSRDSTIPDINTGIIESRNPSNGYSNSEKTSDRIHMRPRPRNPCALCQRAISAVKDIVQKRLDRVKILTILLPW